jgi:hypothetical protein
VFDAIRELMAAPESKKHKIGFLVKEQAAPTEKPRAATSTFPGILETWKCHFDRVVGASEKLEGLSL